MHQNNKFNSAKYYFKKTILFAIPLFFLASCVDHDKNKISKVPLHQIDYCHACDSLDTWISGIQINNISDSTCCFKMAECHSNYHYDLIWVPKGNIIKIKAAIGEDSLTRFYNTQTSIDNKDLVCYAFTVNMGPRKTPQNDEEIEEYWDYYFPSRVEAIKKTKEGWVLLKTATINSFEEFGRFKLMIIYENQ